jgi:hypothetical protein
MRRLRRVDLFGVAVVAAVAVGVLSLPAAVRASSPIVVTTTNDGGPGSLRQAIADANASPGSTIIFHIPESDPGFNASDGWFSIVPLTQLPILSADGTTLDGFTQTAFTGDTNPAGPEIFLDGRSTVLAASPDPPRSLWIESSSTVEGLTVSGYAGDEIYISGANGAIVRGDYVGTDPTGMSAIAPPIDLRTFENEGVQIVDGATNTTIGGTSAADRNVISGNTGAGVYLSSPDNGVVIEGNYIGTNATGTAALANGRGIAAGPDGNWQNEPGPTNVTIGGTALGAGNLVSGNGLGSQMNGSLGIGLGGVSGFTIQGNLIGTDATGSHAIPNDSDGVQIFDDVADTVIGGTSAAARNVISGNAEAGIHVFGTMPGGSGILGNYIGTDATGAQPLGNGLAGIVVDGATGTSIGGVAAGAGNVISGNGSPTGPNAGGPGILVFDFAQHAFIVGNTIGLGADGATPVPNENDGIEFDSGASGSDVKFNTIASNDGIGVDLLSGTSNTLIRNSIFSNGGLGIDLGGDGVTLNNCCGHGGPNDFENFPVLTSAIEASGHVTVVGTLDTASPHSAEIEVFADPQPGPGGDASGYGEGAVFLGTVTPSANGSFTVVLPSVAQGALITATATDANGNTSEFSHDLLLASTVAPAIASFSPNHGTAGTSVTITGSGFAGATAVAFAGTAASAFTVTSNTSLTATVASGTTTGPVSVTAPGGTTSSSARFYLPPTIGGVSPANAAVHATVTVSGTNLLGATQVQLGGVSVPFSVASNSRLTFTVPVGSAGGTIHVSAPGGSDTSADSVTILPPPAITGISPGSGPVGTPVTITGTDLGGTVGVQLGSIITVPTSVAPGSVTFTIPPGAASGTIRVLTTTGSATSTDLFAVTG